MDENKALVLGLNPFEIRASVQPRSQWHKRVNRSLNPFEIRASVQLALHLQDLVRQVSLNPFEIRASVQRWRWSNGCWHMSQSL